MKVIRSRKWPRNLFYCLSGKINEIFVSYLSTAIPSWAVSPFAPVDLSGPMCGCEYSSVGAEDQTQVVRHNDTCFTVSGPELIFMVYQRGLIFPIINYVNVFSYSIFLL